MMQTEVYPQLQTVVTPMGKFLQLWTDDKHNPGNLLLKNLHQLKDMIHNLENLSPTASVFSLRRLGRNSGRRESSLYNADRDSLERDLTEIDTLKGKLASL